MFVMCRSGDMCDDDKDGDNIPNDEDNCELTKNTDQGDIDEDGIGDECDNCPEIANKDQTDDNQNFIGDICELGRYISSVFESVNQQLPYPKVTFSKCTDASAPNWHSLSSFTLCSWYMF